MKKLIIMLLIIFLVSAIISGAYQYLRLNYTPNQETKDALTKDLIICMDLYKAMDA